LTRAFNRPRLEPRRETLFLAMDQVAGIVSLSLNGESIAKVSGESSHYEIELLGLLERNVLTLEIEIPAPTLEPFSKAEDWGIISLLVRTVEPTDDAAWHGPGRTC
jgi:hypothetical protein